jgi:superfamily II DNA/RNA helicase
VATIARSMKAATGTLVFTESIATAEMVADDLYDQGLRADTVHSGQGPSERHDVLADFRARRLDVVVAPRVLDEGIDVPEADLAVIVAASKTRRQMIQRMGRVLRRKSDDRLARFAIFYLRDTNEDPACGAHEAFLGEVVSVADQVSRYCLPEQRGAVLADLSTFSRSTTVLPARRVGEAERTDRQLHQSDEDVPAAAFYGLQAQRASELRACRHVPPSRQTSDSTHTSAIADPAPDLSRDRQVRIKERFRRSRPIVSSAELHEFDGQWPVLARFSDQVLLRAFELRTPLSSMHGQAAALQARMDEIAEAGRRAAEMVDVRKAEQQRAYVAPAHKRRRPQRQR